MRVMRRRYLTLVDLTEQGYSREASEKQVRFNSALPSLDTWTSYAFGYPAITGWKRKIPVIVISEMLIVPQ